MFISIIESAVAQFVPVKSKPSSKGYPMKMTKEAKKAREQKALMWNRYDESKSYNDWIEYKLVEMGKSLTEKL